MPQNPVIVIPGITATGLRDEYPVNSERVWTLIKHRFDRIALHPDDLRYEQIGPSRVVPDEIWALPYKEMIAELRHDLADHADEPVPVYPFPYDWRQPLEETQRQLGWFIDEVINRTLLLRHYHKPSRSGRAWADRPRVDLVGHSMGGLIAAGYLATLGHDSAVGKVATLGTPFRGSLEAVLKLATGEGSPGGERTAQRDREVARLTPAVYHLLPDFKEAIADRSVGGPRSFLHMDAMQPGTWASIAEAIRLHAVKKRNAGERTEAAKQLLSEMLAQARSHRKSTTDSSLLTNAGLDENDWLCIVGVGDPTRVHARIGREGKHARYDLESLGRVDRWGKSDPVLTGDGTVPYLGAKPAFLPTSKLVLVKDNDFRWLAEFKDRAIEMAAGLHGLLPTMNLCQRLIVSHFRGRPFGRVYGRVPPDLAPGQAWDPPIAGLRAKS